MFLNQKINDQFDKEIKIFPDHPHAIRIRFWNAIPCFFLKLNILFQDECFSFRFFLNCDGAMLAALNGEELDVCNLGDSGCLIVRNGEVLFASKEQTHGFNVCDP